MTGMPIFSEFLIYNQIHETNSLISGITLNQQIMTDDVLVSTKYLFHTSQLSYPSLPIITLGMSAHG